MFYPTTLISVGNGRAIDVEGKNLTFIGYMSVKEGDSVWTDGQVIFGNAPPKSTPTIAIDPSGVPVLGDTLRGYVNKSGLYRKKDIAEDDWIINDEKNFKHGTSTTYLDVEIDENKKEPGIYTAELHQTSLPFIGIYHDGNMEDFVFTYKFNKAKEYVDAKKNQLLQENPNIYRPCDWSRYALPEFSQEQVLGFKIDRQGNWDAIISSMATTTIKVVRHGYLANRPFDFVEWPPYKYSKKTIPLDWEAELFGMKQEMYEEILEYLHERRIKWPGDYGAVTMELLKSVNATVPIYGEFLKFSVARTLTIEHWEYYPVTGVKPPNAYQFFDNNRDLVKIFSHYVVHVKNGKLIEIIDDISGYSFYEKVVEHLSLTESADPNDKLIMIDDSSFPYGEMDRIRITGLISLLHEEEADNIQYKNVYLYRNIEKFDGECSDPSLGKNADKIFTFPLQDGYYAEMTLWQIKAIYSDTGEKICGELPIQDNKAYRTFLEIDKNEDGITVANYSNGNSNGNGVYPVRKIFSDGSGIVENIPTQKIRWGFYTSEKDSEIPYFIPNVSVTKLSKTKYLIGFHGGNLYLSDNGNIKKINETDKENLKNFRLRELKNLNKAKK